MNLGVLFSGGKDSVFACYRAMEKEDVKCLITLISENEESYMFHTPNIGLAELVASAIGIDILKWRTPGVEEMELEDLRDAIIEARRLYGIEGIVTGAIESVYQSSRIQRICSELDLWCFNPLWQIDQLDYLKMLIAHGFRVIVTGVFAYPLDESFLGAEIDDGMIAKLEMLQKRYGISPSGEGGELETLVLDGPIFRRRLEVLRAARLFSGNRGRYVIESARLAEKPGHPNNRVAQRS
ncbi:MAG: diphthine--ammonia ligase [Methanothrix sp.]|uniref:diphthine--ammonia ligase n=1 Tax=Methanothrix sp. TaxID=90426 RepID=UPI0025F4FE6F|nr:diphthine--ammonia ligase [Methanothrix sp.]MCQ8903350.1 diphthine--ammonia ligase [Methanothrix sp.]